MIGDLGSKAFVLSRQAQGYELWVFVLHACTALHLSQTSAMQTDACIHG